jgi:TolA-binding protein
MRKTHAAILLPVAAWLAAVPVASAPAGEDLGDRLRRELGAAAVAEEENPLLEVAQRMRQVEGRIVRNDAGPQTQGLQRQIVADLEELIRQAQKCCQQGAAGGKPSPLGSPAGQPKQGRGGMGTKPNPKPGSTSSQQKDDGQPRKLDKQQVQTLVERLWDVALPPQQRNELRQSPFDEFLPKYELLIEQYYRRLAEEKEDR